MGYLPRFPTTNSKSSRTTQEDCAALDLVVRRIQASLNLDKDGPDAVKN